MAYDGDGSPYLIVGMLHQTGACSGAIIGGLGETDLSNEYSNCRFEEGDVETFLQRFTMAAREAQSEKTLGHKCWRTKKGYAIWDMGMICCMTNQYQKNAVSILEKIGFTPSELCTSKKNAGIETRFWTIPVSKFREVFIENGLDPEKCCV